MKYNAKLLLLLWLSSPLSDMDVFSWTLSSFSWPWRKEDFERGHQSCLSLKRKMSILVTMAKLVDTLIGPAVMLLYPLFSSMLAIKYPSPVDYQKWLTYWVLYALITLFELSCWRVLQQFTLWPELKVVFCIWLVLPCFDGAAYIHENHHIRRYVRTGVDVGSAYMGLKRRVMQMLSLDASRSVERYLDRQGAEALERVVKAAVKEARRQSRKRRR
nr:PREDICTED: HVA22-like protein f isoform X3 [Musa acuminata subsp. malaccensis]